MTRLPAVGAVLLLLLVAGNDQAGAAWAPHTTNPANTLSAGSIAAPTGVTATAGLVTFSVAVAWTPPPLALRGTATRIDRNVNGGSYSLLTTVSGGATASYNDAVGLSALTTYCYELTTVDGLWTAGPTTPACATTIV